MGVQAADQTMSTTVYDADSLPERTLDRNGTVISNTYDGAHRLLTRRAQRLASDLEGTGQAVEGTTEQAYEWDGLSRLRMCSDNNGLGGDDVVTSYTYDSRSLPLTETQQFRVIARPVPSNLTIGRIQVFTGGSSISCTIQSQWDPDSNRIGVTYSSGRQLTIQRDGLDRMQQVSDGGGVIAGWEFVGGRPVQCDTRNGVRTSYAYDQKRRITGIDHQKNLGTGDRVVGFGYTWDRADRRTSETSLLAGFPGNPILSLPTSTDTYTYDSAYRVTDVTRDRGRQDTGYQIDGVGNWVSKTEGGQTQTFNQRNNGQNSPDLMNEYHRLLFFDATGLLTSEDQPVHDANGNRIQDSDYKLFFDLFDRLVRVERVSDGVTVGEYKYDCAGRRVYKRFLNPATGLQEETFFVCDGAQEVEELDGTGAVVADYVWGGLYVDQAVQMRRGGQDYYYHHNSVFSVAAVTDGSGAAAERYSYSSIYGVQQVLDGGGNARAPPDEIGNPWRFQGRRIDPETGFYYFRQRYLDPAQGRFVSRDPLGLWGDPGNLGNPYAYAGCDPVNRVDPFGLFFDTSDILRTVETAKAGAKSFGTALVNVFTSKKEGAEQAYEEGVEYSADVASTAAKGDVLGTDKKVRGGASQLGQSTFDVTFGEQSIPARLIAAERMGGQEGLEARLDVMVDVVLLVFVPEVGGRGGSYVRVRTRMPRSRLRRLRSRKTGTSNPNAEVPSARGSAQRKWGEAGPRAESLASEYQFSRFAEDLVDPPNTWSFTGHGSPGQMGIGASSYYLDAQGLFGRLRAKPNWQYGHRTQLFSCYSAASPGPGQLPLSQNLANMTRGPVVGFTEGVVPIPGGTYRVTTGRQVTHLPVVNPQVIHPPHSPLAGP